MEMNYLKGLLESLSIALACNDLARQGKFEEVKAIILSQEMVQFLLAKVLVTIMILDVAVTDIGAKPKRFALGMIPERHFVVRTA